MSQLTEGKCYCVGLYERCISFAWSISVYL